MEGEIASQAVLSLPAPWYRDAGIHERERQAIFRREWHLLGHLGALAGPGDFIAGDIAGWAVFVIRDRDGALKGFHNQCRHRAAPLLAGEAGHCDVLRCPYHGWVYDSAGRLRQTPEFGAALDKERLGLHAIVVDVWRDLVFVNLDPGCPPLAEGLGALVEEAAGYPMEEFTIARRVSYDIACDWKVYVENYVEGYHIPYLHPDLNAQIDAKAYTVRNRGRVCIHEAPSRTGAVYNGRWLWRYPNLSLAVYPDGMNLSRTLPLGLGRTRLYIDFFFRDMTPAAERAMSTTRAVVEEDFPICEAVQHSLESGLYQGGPLSPRHEGGIVMFHSLVRAAVGV
jgi:choline monooxygenase